MCERISRERDDDRCFPQPEDWDTPMWRYMDLWKFKSFLSEGLYFSRLDHLGDEWEGALPHGTADNLDATLAACPELMPFKADVEANWKLDYESLKKDTFVRCWHSAGRNCGGCGKCIAKLKERWRFEQHTLVCTIVCRPIISTGQRRFHYSWEKCGTARTTQWNTHRSSGDVSGWQCRSGIAFKMSERSGFYLTTEQ